MPKVTYTSAKGLIQESGTGISFSELPYSPVQAKTAAFTVSTPGVYTITAGGAVAVTMPLASAFPGGTFVFRNGDAYANFLTGSAETAGTKVFAQYPGTGATQGAKLTLTAATGNSVAVISDGKNYIVAAASGSFTVGE
jgi:hypothetical protein